MQYEDLLDFRPILYYDVLSASARSCQMLIDLLKIDMDLQSTDSVEDLDFDDTYTWLNSFCRLPTLVVDGNITLCSGHSILIYLCQKYGSKSVPNLCPCDYISRQKLTSLLYYEGSTLNRCLGNLLTDIMLAKYPNIDVKYHKRKVSTAYNSLNTFLTDHCFMNGNCLTIADIAIVSTVSALNIIFPINYGKFPKLCEWFQRLKQMHFYRPNEEGIQKLRHILKKVGRFNFPSTLNDDDEKSMELNIEAPNAEADKTTAQTKNYSEFNDSDNEKEKATTSTRKCVKNIWHKEQNMRDQQEFAEHTHDGLQENAEKFQFYDTYFINVSKCNCCAVAEPNKCKRVPNEVQKRAEMFEHLASAAEDDFRKPGCQNRQLYSGCKKGVCCSTKEFMNKMENEIQEEHSKNTENFSFKSRTGLKNNLKKPVEYDQSSTSASDDNEPNHKLEISKQQITQQDKLRNQDKNRIKGVKSLSKLLKETSVDVANNCCASQVVQKILEKCCKYEKILENTDKVLKKKNSVQTKPLSDTSSIDSLNKEQTEGTNFPLECDVPNCSCEQKLQQCGYNRKDRKGSRRVEALEFDETIPTVLPKFLVAKSENEFVSDNPTTQIGTGKRLEAGTNLSPLENKASLMNDPRPSEKFQFTSEDSDDSMPQSSERLSKLIYLSCKECPRICNSTNTCRCRDCSGKRNTTKSKIPCLVSYGSLVNGSLYKISLALEKEIDRVRQNKQTMTKFH